VSDLAIDNHPWLPFRGNGAVRDQGERESIVILIETEVLKDNDALENNPEGCCLAMDVPGHLTFIGSIQKIINRILASIHF
jgi:hypothetical protein